MTYCRILLLFLVAGMRSLRAQMGTSAADNPCPDVFKYEGSSGSEYGIITVPNPYPYLVIDIRVTIYINAPLPPNSATILGAVDSDVWSKLEAGSMDPVLYRIDFPVTSPLPTIKSITVNGNAICNGTRPDGGYLTTVTTGLETFSSKCGSTSLECQFNKQQSLRGSEKQSSPFPQQPQNGSSINIQCGTRALRSIPLIAGGEDTYPGQWPWHVVLYVNIKRQTKFCGGSFVGTRTIITAAHCVTNEGRQLKAEDIKVYLGRHNLRNMDEEGSQYRAVSNILVHPSYNTITYVGDIAVLILSTSVEVTAFVRPVCLWGPDNSNPADITNKTGLVVGWGLDETDRPTDELMMVKMPVVSQQTCILHHPTYLQVTSSGTFCAGYRNGSSVCPGDDGGGMVFSRQLNDGTNVWMLRGIVSVGRLRGGSCDTNTYVVFTDVAEYLDWIYEILM